MIASRPNKSLFGVASLFIAFLFFCVNQALQGQACYTAYSSGGSYSSGSQVSYNGKNWTCAGGQGHWCDNPSYAPGSLPGVWNDNGACSACSVGDGSSDPTVLQNTAMTNITHATSGVTGVTSSTGLPSGVTASYSSDVLTISGTPTATGTFNYTIDLDGCDDDATGTITVTACTVGSASSTPTIMKDVAMTNITHATGGVTGVTSSTGLPSGVTASYLSDVLTISGTPTASGTYNYTIDLDGCGTDATGTIVVLDGAPGGEATNLLLWLKADAQTFEDASPGTDATEDGDDVLQWHDQSGLSHDATVATGRYPHYDEDAFNFNPGIVFTQSSSEYLQISGGIFDANTITGASAYVVCSHESATNSAVFNEPLTGSEEFMFLAQWSTDDSYWQVGSGTIGSGRSYDANWKASSDGTQYIWSMGNNSSNATSGGEEQYVRLDGQLDDTQNGYDATATGNNNDFYIGKWTDNTSEFNGTMAELIVYDKILSATEEIQVQSYLALKYGITLNDDADADASAGEVISGSITEGDYLAADGSTVVWDYSTNSAYHNDVAGIGADATSGLDQRISKSRNSDAIVTMCTEAIGTLNSGISTALTDDTYLLWGNNNASTSANTDLPSGYTGRLQKEWVVEMTGTVSNVHVEFDLTNGSPLAGGAAADYYLLVDADGDFTSGASATVASSFSSNKVTFDDVNFSDGQYFTLATQKPGPGGITSNLIFWLKADAGTSTTTNAAEVTSWTEQISSVTNTGSAGSVPTYLESGINYNPSLNFDGSSEKLTINDLSNLPSGAEERSLIIVGQLGTGDNNYRYAFSHGNDVTGEAHGFGQSNSALVGSYNGRSSNSTYSNYFTIDDAFIGAGYYSGTQAVLGKDGELLDSTARSWNTKNSEGGSVGYVGAWVSSGLYWQGEIAEIISFNERLGYVNRLKVMSYLGIKYGITQTVNNDGDGTSGETISGSITEGDYLDSDGSTVLWDYSAYSSYHYDIAGLGRDDNSGLHQKQSKSANSDAIVTMSTEAIATTNAGISTTLTDGTYLLWGNNNASTSANTDLPSGYTGRLQKEWVVEMTGTVSNVHVEFDISSNGLAGDAGADYYLLVDADGDFTSGASATVASSFSSGKVTFDDVNFTDGQYFTLATQKAAPGALASNLHLWLKADAQTFSDAGSTASADGTEVQEWHDQSGNSFDADDSGGNGPDWDADGINFNPTLDFTGGASGEPLDIPNGIMEGGTKTDMYVYSVATIDLTQNQTLFYQDLHTGTSNQVFSFIPHFSNSSSYWDNGHTTTGRVGPVTSGVTLGQPHLFSLKSTTNSMEIKRDNNSIGSNSDNGSSTENNTQPFYIGYQWNNSGNYFDGKLSELIIYDGVPTSTEEDQIESYLAVKYGITLASTNYLSSDGTVIWNNSSYSSYHYDIAGLGRDDDQGLHQKQSKSINSDAIVTMSTEAIGTTNAGISTQITDGAYLLWGNNDASSSANADLPTGYTGRTQKEWVVEMTGTVSNAHIEFDITGLTLGGDAASDFYLLIDADGDFTSGVASETVAASFSSNKVIFDDINFTDGQYFTLATKDPTPGGITDHVRLWLKADAGTNTSTEDADVTAWADQSLNSYDADDVGSNPPSFKTNGINFNPALDFSGSEDLRIEDGITTTTSSPQYFFYVVSKRETSGAHHTLFRQNLGSNRWLIFRHLNSASHAGYEADFFYGSNTNGRHFSTWDYSAVKPHLWSFGSSRDSDNTPNNTHQYIQLDNTTIDHDDNTSNVTSNSTNDFFIGADHQNSHNYDGLIAEIICLDDIPTDDEDLQIKSYLALKYGISLGATTDLKNSAGTVIWDKDYGDGTYTNDISGIGRDDLSGFNQKQSKSVNSDDIMTMSTQAIAASNAANTTQLSNDVSFEMWANNGGSVAIQASEKPASFSQRLTREWLVQETGTVGGVTIEFDLTGLTFDNPTANKFGLVIDDDGDFSGGTQTTEVASSFSSDKLTFNSVDLSNGKYITVMNGATVLPVELIYFEGKRVGSYVLLEWETMSEVNNDYFIVEKSTDGENWEEILTVDGQGNTSEQTYYSQIDIDGCEDVCYYRLKQFDFDGQSEESKIIVLESENKTQEFKISVSPNPVNQMANIAFTAPEGGMFSLTVTTQTGQVMYTAKTIGDKGNNHISYNASMLSSGSYYFILEDENGNRTQQLVIK